MTYTHELVIIWSNGDPKKQVFPYCGKADAEAAGQFMKMAFGNQIEWCGIRRIY